MTKEGALNILSDKAITEADDLPIAVKALIALELERHGSGHSEHKCQRRYEVESDGIYWMIFDRVWLDYVLHVHQQFPDAEFMARTQCDFLNQSPACGAD